MADLTKNVEVPSGSAWTEIRTPLGIGNNQTWELEVVGDVAAELAVTDDANSPSQDLRGHRLAEQGVSGDTSRIKYRRRNAVPYLWARGLGAEGTNALIVATQELDSS